HLALLSANGSYCRNVQHHWISQANPAAKAMGKFIQNIIAPHPPHPPPAGFGRFWPTGVNQFPEIPMSIAVHKTGKQMKIGISVKALYGEKGKIVGVEATFHQSAEAV